MAGSIDYLYDPQQNIYAIVACGDVPTLAVRPGIVIRVNGSVLVSGSDLGYDVRIDGESGTSFLQEEDIFPDLTSAVTEYENRLT